LYNSSRNGLTWWNRFPPSSWYFDAHFSSKLIFLNSLSCNCMEMSKADLIQKSSYCRVSGRDMDLLELSAYGNVRRGQDSRGVESNDQGYTQVW
ncbi:hypothetical protein IFM89_038969, partial [Coptis chinensis]